jgi:hypothetical protein
MKLTRMIALVGAVSLLLIPLVAGAATDTQTLTINATVAARAKLVLAPTTINFPDADPDVTNPIPANENGSITVLANVRTTSVGVSTLVCLANGDLVAAGANDIPITNVTWTATGAGYLGGTMNNASTQAVGSFTGSGANVGTFDYFLANSWAYDVGNYTQTVLYTLTTP